MVKKIDSYVTYLEGNLEEGTVLDKNKFRKMKYQLNDLYRLSAKPLDIKMKNLKSHLFTDLA